MDLFREKHILGTNQSKQMFISLRYTLGLLEHFDFLQNIKLNVLFNRIKKPAFRVDFIDVLRYKIGQCDEAKRTSNYQSNQIRTNS